MSSSLAVRDEDVALVAYGPDEPRMLGIGFDLLAQPHNAQIHAAVERVPIPLLVEIQDAFTRQRSVGVFRKRLEQVKLQRGHRYVCALLVHQPVCGEVEYASPDAHPCSAKVGAARGRSAPQYALDPGQQLTRVEGFGNVVVGTHLEA